jgi:hypothetical protein
MKERSQIIIKLLATHILLLPGLVFVSFIFSKDLFLLISITQSVLLILFIAGYWEFFGMRFKWIYFVGLEFLLLMSLWYRLYKGEAEMPALAGISILLFFQIYLFWLIIKIFRVIFISDNEKLEIEFPFGEGLYLITDGGNSKISRLMNYHFHSPGHKKRKTNKAMLFATDIIKIDKNNTSFIPHTNEEYAIFNENLFSPMEGVVIKVINEIDDNLPFSGNYPYNTGNTVVIKRDNYFILLGHMKKGSIVVNEGDPVKRGIFLGKAGNSGMSERPHLHMQLMKSETADYWKGLGICIQYKNRNLYKNRLIEIM